MSSGLCRVPLLHKSDVCIVPRLVAFAIMRHISNEGVESRLYRWVMSLSMSHVSNARVEARLEWMRHVVGSMHSPCNAQQHTTSEYSQNQRSHARSHNVHARIMPSHVCMTHHSWCGSSQEWDTTFEAHMRVLGDVGGVVWVYENTFHKTLQTFHLGVWKDFSSQKNMNESSQEWVYVIHIDTRPVLLYMGWLRLVSSLKLLVSFAKEPYKSGDILQNRPIMLSTQDMSCAIDRHDVSRYIYIIDLHLSTSLI